MPYLGNPAVDRFTSTKAASVYSGNGSTVAFTLEHSVGADEDILVSVDGVIQEPSVAYAVSSGTTLTFTAAPSTNSGNNIFVYYLFRTIGTVTHPPTSALSATSGTFSGEVDAASLDISGNIDVDGVTNLDVVDIDGAVDMATTLAVGGNVDFNGDLDVDGTTNLDAVDIDGTVTQGSNTSDLRFNINSSNQYGLKFFNAGNSSGTLGGRGADIMTFSNAAGGTIMEMNAGQITKPLQPAFLARTNSTISNFAVATLTTVAYGTEIFDQNADYNNSNYTFTAPVTGRYQLNVILILHNLDSASAYYQTQLITSNRIYHHLVDTDYGQDNIYQNLNVNILADMDASDTAIVRVYQASGTQQSDIDSTSSFSGHLVC